MRINVNCISCLPQKTKGYEFESETDTEVIPKLIKYVYDNRESDTVSFSTLVERVIQQLVSISDTAKHDLQHRLLPPQKHTNPFNSSPGSVSILIFVFLAWHHSFLRFLRVIINGWRPEYLWTHTNNPCWDGPTTNQCSETSDTWLRWSSVRHHIKLAPL